MREPDALRDARTKALAAAEAIYRITDLPSFDPALKFALRKQATEILGGITGVVLFTEVRRTAERERIAALIAATRELIAFAASRNFIAPINAERVAGAYRQAGECLSVVFSGDESGAAAYPSNDVDAPPSSAPAGPPTADLASSSPAGPAAAILNDRQVKIIAYLSDNGRAQLGDIRQLFGDAYSEKTLQRDIWQLVASGRVKRQGDNRWTVYLPR